MTNVDVDGDGIPDINIDTDGDGRPDINIDTSGDWKPDINIDTDNTGEWKPSTEGGNGDGIWKPDKNIDTNGQRLCGQKTASCFQRCVGMDAFNAVYSTTFECDKA
ncbi:hypothetical protein, partial [Clostridioides difficile]|uniref:hypothetical protein n=1 Tax=Clostridioides difficile TaxID=1496 RepID=UPI001F2F2796